MDACPRCNYVPDVDWATCPRCGEKRGGAHPMGLVLWMLLIFTIPIYPIAGGAALLAALAVSGISALFGLHPFLWFTAIITLPVVAFFVGFKQEQRAAYLPAYRIARKLLRYATCAGVIAYVLTVPTELPGGEIFGVILLMPIVLFLVNLADFIFEAGGPDCTLPKSWLAIPESTRDFLIELKWNEAVIYGFPVGVLGFLIGQDTRILFGLFAWVFVTLSILGVKIMFRVLGFVVSTGLHAVSTAKARAATSEPSVKIGRGSLGSVPWRILRGAGIGAITGAVLGQILDGRVQIEAVIIMAVLGVIVSLIAGALLKRRAG